MTKAELGALKEARYMGEILLASPTMENYARYRMALVNMARVFDCTFSEACTKLQETN